MRRLIFAIIFVLLSMTRFGWCQDICQKHNCFISGKTGHLVISSTITSSEFDNAVFVLQFFKSNGIKQVVIWLNSPGGSVFDALSIAYLLLDYQRDGSIVEVRCYGLAASAAVMILVSGSYGYRYLSKSSFVMVHELSVVKFLEVQSLSSIEKEATVMRKIQSSLIGFLASRTKMSYEDLVNKVKEETWIPADEAIRLGFADKLIE